MFEAPRPKRIRLSEASIAIGATYKAVRQWVDRQGVGPTAEQTNGWMEFSWGDVAALAITKPLVELGMSASEAFQTAQKVLRTRYSSLFGDEPRWLVTDENANMLFLARRGGEWFSNADNQPWEANPGVRGDIVIVVQVEQIVERAFDRLAAMGHLPPTLEEAWTDPKVKLRNELLRSIHYVNALPEETTRRHRALIADIRRIAEAINATKDDREIQWANEQLRRGFEKARAIEQASLAQPHQNASSSPPEGPPSDPPSKPAKPGRRRGRPPRSTSKGKPT
jgi:hypothetical protein